MTSLPDALSVLSAMITPAVLISGCGSLIMATSGRLNRAVDRTRELFQQFAAVAAEPAGRDALDEERRMLFRQLDFTTTRSRLLQRALSRLYWALGVFVGTSVAIGLVAIGGRAYAWAPIGLGLGGAALLLYACVLLVHESRLALAALDAEMDFVWQQGKRHASPELLDLQMPAGDLRAPGLTVADAGSRRRDHEASSDRSSRASSLGIPAACSAAARPQSAPSTLPVPL